jgi:hypothetical protein
LNFHRLFSFFKLANWIFNNSFELNLSPLVFETLGANSVGQIVASLKIPLGKPFYKFLAFFRLQGTKHTFFEIFFCFDWLVWCSYQFSLWCWVEPTNFVDSPPTNFWFFSLETYFFVINDNFSSLIVAEPLENLIHCYKYQVFLRYRDHIFFFIYFSLLSNWILIQKRSI